MTLKAARINAGYNQKNAALEIGVSVDTLKNYERGKTFPDVPVIQRIENAYSVKYEDLIFLPSDYPLRVCRANDRT